MYFLYGYVFHYVQIQRLMLIKESTPVFFERYSNLILAYSFIKERIINDNSVESFYSKTSESYSPKEIDEAFKQKSLQNEARIKDLRN
jgi:hypothetical protein